MFAAVWIDGKGYMMESLSSPDVTSDFSQPDPAGPFLVASLSLPPVSHSYWLYASHRYALPEVIHDMYAQLCSQHPIVDEEQFQQLRHLSHLKLGARIALFFPSTWHGLLDDIVYHVVDMVMVYLQVSKTWMVELHVTKHVDADDPRIEVDVFQLIEVN